MYPTGTGANPNNRQEKVSSMLGLRLVRLIEKHSEEIAASLTTKLHTSERSKGYRNVGEDELRIAMVSLYAHLEEWLLNKSDGDVERHFREIGGRRARQGISSSQMAWALMMSRSELWAFVYRESGAEKALELYGELELLESLNGFFDRAIYYALAGYEQQARGSKAA